MEKKGFVVATVFAVLAVFGLIGLAGCDVPTGSGGGANVHNNEGGTFVAVTGITGVSTGGVVNAAVDLDKASVVPANATNKVIVWTASGAGLSGTVSGTVTPSTAGTLALTATIANGKAAGTAYTQNFSITVVAADDFVAVTGITGVPETGTAGTVIDLSGAVVAPDTATNKAIVWSKAGDSSVDATISGTSVTPQSAGDLKLTATVANGITNGTANYTQDFTVTVAAASGSEGGLGEQLEPTNMEGFAFNSTVDSSTKTTVGAYSGDAVTIATGEELTAYFEVLKNDANQTVTVKDGKDKAKVTLHTSGTVDGSATADDLVVAEVDMEDLLFDGTDADGKAVRSFDLLVEEAGKAAVTVAVNLELTLPPEASIYQKINDKWTRVAAELTEADIKKYKVTGTTSSKYTYGASTLGNPGAVDNLQKAFAWVNVRAEAGTGSSLEAGTTQGYSEYRILIKKNEKIGRVILTFNEKDYVSLELYGAGVPGNAEWHITLNHDEWKTKADVLLAVPSLSSQGSKGLITLDKENNSNFHTFVLGKNITLDGRRETSPETFEEYVVSNTSRVINLKYRI
jgi:hypothetical protein